MADRGDLIAGRYRIVSRVGSGAMGVVWHAEDTVLHRGVAIKQLLINVGMTAEQTKEARLRAMREGRIAARLHHLNAISVYDVLEHDGQPCLIMEYLPSRSLADLMAEQGPLPPDQVARIGRQIASALAAAHDAGIVHRDVKPGNVLLAEDGRAKLTDFGISRAVGDSTVTATGILAGTPAYLAPEVAQGREATWRSDVFSLGSTLYAAVEGRPPFGTDENTMATLHRVATGEIIPPRQAGPLTAVLRRMLHRDPEWRPGAGEVSRILATIAEPGQSGQPVAPAASPVFGASTPAASTPIASTPAASTPAAPTPIASTLGGVPVEPVTGRGQRGGRRAAIIAGLAGAVLLTTGILVAVLVNSGQPSASHPSATGPSTTTGPSTPTTTRALSEQLSAAIVDYYHLMPTNTQEGWVRLTTDYQVRHAGGLTGYENFWRPIQRVAVSNVVATPPSTVRATIDYYYKDGHVDEERTSFGLVRQGDVWKIGSSTVLSHRSFQS